MKYFPSVNVNQDSLDLIDKIKLYNNDKFLDFVVTVNADMLAQAGTFDKFEAVDEVAKYYKRNFRMYSNLNRIDLKEDVRVFILMRTCQTAFFRDFMRKSPK